MQKMLKEKFEDKHTEEKRYLNLGTVIIIQWNIAMLRLSHITSHLEYSVPKEISIKIISYRLQFIDSTRFIAS